MVISCLAVTGEKIVDLTAVIFDRLSFDVS